MKIRKANKFDVGYFIETTYKIQQLEHNQFVSNVKLNNDYLTILFNQVVYGQGTAFVITEDKQPIGIIAGIVNPLIWEPHTRVMNLLTIYVEPEYRYTSAAHKLISSYTDEGKKMIKNKQIINYTFNATEPMFNVQFSRFGYEVKEMTWVGGL